jgi:hypothetical protein
MESCVTTINVISNALRVAWSKETSNDQTWSSTNPAVGQCAVSACVLQDHIGGDILHTNATSPNGKKVSHYYNNLNTVDIDVTKQQFPEGTTFSEPDQRVGDFKTIREYCLSYPDTLNRYELLKTKVTHLVRDSKFIN